MHVVVVGAGFSGLMAARALTRAGPFWRARGYSGMITSDELPSNLVCADSSLSEAGLGFLMGFMEASGGMLWTGKGKEAGRAAVTARLVKFFRADAERVLDYEDQVGLQIRGVGGVTWRRLRRDFDWTDGRESR